MSTLERGPRPEWVGVAVRLTWASEALVRQRADARPRAGTRERRPSGDVGASARVVEQARQQRRPVNPIGRPNRGLLWTPRHPTRVPILRVTSPEPPQKAR